MTNECPVCGRYMVDPVTPLRCDRCEIARLREAIKKRHNAALRFLTAKTTDIGDPESNAALSDLAEAEAELDRIAREGR